MPAAQNPSPGGGQLSLRGVADGCACVAADARSFARRWSSSLALRALAAAGACSAVASGALLLYTVRPTAGSIYPPCPLHFFTGLHCPGCGTLRCLHALLHGDLPQALAFNQLTVLCLPMLAIYAGYRLSTWTLGVPSRWPRTPAWMILLLFAVIVLFGVLRNVPAAPFSALAPTVVR